MQTHRWSLRVFGLGVGIALMLSFASAAWADAKVWVNTSSGVYHCPSSPYYGATKRGKTLNESEATGHGYRAAYGQTCSAPAAQQTRKAERVNLAANATGNSIVVWVNTSTNVYHCPGTRYFGATKHGEYMPEADAIAAGNRGVGGKRC